MINPPVDDEKYGKTNFDKPAHSMYYYHAIVNAGKLSAINFFHHNGDYRIKQKTLETVIRRLAVNAKYTVPHNGKGHVPPIHGIDFGDVWRRKSFIVILLDDEREIWKELGAVTVEPNANHPNYAFFDAKRYMIDVSETGNRSKMRSAICFRNHMKGNHQGKDIDENDGPQKFSFKLHTESERFGPYDAEGTNMGPPSPPPTFIGIRKFLAWLLHA